MKHHQLFSVQKIVFFINLFILISFTGLAQTKLYVPGGSSNIGNNSTNNNVGIGVASPSMRLTLINSPADGTNETGITWSNTNPTRYGIFRTAGTWDFPNYQQLNLSWSTGIILDPGAGGGNYDKSYVDVKGKGLMVTGGNLGVGTTDPSAKLHVALSNGGRIFAGYGGQPAISLLPKTSGGGSWFHMHNLSNTGGNGLQFSHGSTAGQSPIMTLLASGDVGVGITSPIAGFHLKRETVVVESPSSGAKSWLPYTNGEVYLTGDKEAPGGDGSLHFRTFSQSESYVDRMIIKGNGNIGVGTISPTARFHVELSNGARVLSGYGSESGVSFLPKTSGGGSWFHLHNLSNAGGINGLQFSQGTNVGTSAIMTMLSNGKVGIGTTNTSNGNYKLYVKDGIRTEKVKVDVSSSWADFVFEEDYKLRSLQEVESFVKENKHLPEIPSATEVGEEGIDLGAMDAKLLQKIEELTLYLIEQDKKVNTLIEKVEQLEKENKDLKSNK